MPDETPFQWIFRAPLPEQTGAFTELARGLAARFGSELDAATHQDGLILRSRFGGASLEAEERGRAFWLELHSRCLDQNLAMELVQHFDPPAGWRPLEALAAITPAAPAAARAPHSRQLGDALSASGRQLPGSDARPQPDQREGGSNKRWLCRRRLVRGHRDCLQIEPHRARPPAVVEQFRRVAQIAGEPDARARRGLQLRRRARQRPGCRRMPQHPAGATASQAGAQAQGERGRKARVPAPCPSCGGGPRGYRPH
ncbi:MAG: hypothetical protein ACRDOE_08155 [Streptosporangiaceae bacterium]